MYDDTPTGRTLLLIEDHRQTCEGYADLLRRLGHDVLEAPMPALISCTQALGEPRYPSLKGIMAARSRTIETRPLGELGVDGSGVGGAVATTAVVDSKPPEARGATRVVRDAPDEAARQVVDFLAERRLLKGAN